MFNFDFYLSRREKRVIMTLIIFVISVFIFAVAYAGVKRYFAYKTVSATSSVKEAKVHILNTGNSDCILIQSDKVVVIDGADEDDKSMIVSYLKKHNVETIDYIISTHYHRDHLGSLSTIIREFDVKNVFVSNAKTDSPLYKDFVKSLKEKGLKKEIPTEGEIIPLGTDSYMRIYNTDGGDYVNDESLITFFANGNDKFLFTADAEKKAELEVLDRLEEVDVIKIGHHGSSSSTTDELLNVTKPKIAVITNSETNPYANPSEIVMKRLKEREIEVHRTDECGHVVLISTGEGVHTSCPIGSYRYRIIEQIKGKKVA